MCVCMYVCMYICMCVCVCVYVCVYCILLDILIYLSHPIYVRIVYCEFPVRLTLLQQSIVSVV